jgi:hypothetical protein
MNLVPGDLGRAQHRRPLWPWLTRRRRRTSVRDSEPGRPGRQASSARQGRLGQAWPAPARRSRRASGRCDSAWNSYSSIGVDSRSTGTGPGRSANQSLMSPGGRGPGRSHRGPSLGGCGKSGPCQCSDTAYMFPPAQNWTWPSGNRARATGSGTRISARELCNEERERCC